MRKTGIETPHSLSGMDGAMNSQAGPGFELPMFTIQVNGEPVPASAGQTIAAALIAAGRTVLRHTQSGAPRGVFCGMGVCFDCLVMVDGVSGQRACMTPVRAGMHVETEAAEGVE
jgi:predicted molibdopterin-dependent oxidoreductase YjgC